MRKLKHHEHKLLKKVDFLQVRRRGGRRCEGHAAPRRLQACMLLPPPPLPLPPPPPRGWAVLLVCPSPLPSACGHVAVEE